MEQAMWVQVQDTEKAYYWNPETQHTRWTAPRGVEVQWAVQKTADGAVYYWSKQAREITYELPLSRKPMPVASRLICWLPLLTPPPRARATLCSRRWRLRYRHSLWCVSGPDPASTSCADRPLRLRGPQPWLAT